jgi:Transcriptional regulatory protein, C terminal/FHA domain
VRSMHLDNWGMSRPTPMIVSVREPAHRPIRTRVRWPLMTLGRDPECDLVLHSELVSRRHGRIELRNGFHTYVDEKSTNGSRLNSQPVTGPTSISVGDVLKVADVTLTFQELTQTKPGTYQGASDTLEVDIASRRVWRGNEEVRLGRLEFELLAALWRGAGRACVHHELGAAVWGTNNYGDNDLQKLIQRLRRKLEPEPGQQQLIINVPGVGYRLEV